MCSVFFSQLYKNNNYYYFIYFQFFLCSGNPANLVYDSINKDKQERTMISNTWSPTFIIANIIYQFL